jgi:hypothetical protein
MEKKDSVRDKDFEINSNKSNDTIGKKKEHSSGHDSIIYTKDLMKNNMLMNQIVNTIESCTSSEFRHGVHIFDESSFISRGNDDIENLNIDIKDSNV